jgi:hypothetical protein
MTCRKSIELNVRSPSFAGFCQFIPQSQFNCCLDAVTGFKLFSWWCLFNLKTEAKRLHSSSVSIVWAYFWPTLHLAGQSLSIAYLPANFKYRNKVIPAALQIQMPSWNQQKESWRTKNVVLSVFVDTYIFLPVNLAWIGIKPSITIFT